MSDVIKLLPDSVANQIAAGEVIQRPASVIKELVENAIDAEATRIQIVLKDAGRTLIQVVDNGKGMTETDARLAFERHSTSKISKAEDLFSLHTMGFRGEALASICAISQVELRTRPRDAQIGTRLVMNASRCESQQPDVCPQGCNFMVKNIFFNVPARRKFLKSNQVELSNIIKEFEKLAMVNHHVEFMLSNNGNVLYQLLGGSLKQRIAALWGRNIDQQLIPLHVDTSLVKITGFVCKPEFARKRNYLQYFFVNGRYMRHPYFHKAVLSSYGQLIPDDEQPNYFLDFVVDPETIDVNIHPTKTEIKFENEMPIWQILAAAVKESLGRYIAVPQIDFDTADAPEIPAYNPHTTVSVPDSGVDPHYNPFHSSGKSSQSRPAPAIDSPMTNWELLYQNFEKAKSEGIGSISDKDIENSFGGVQPHVPQAGTDDSQAILLAADVTAVCMQFKNRYILSPVKSGLMIVDQHRAHLKVLYEQYMRQINGKNVTSQRIMFPEVLNLSPAQHIILKELVADMEKMGFSLSQLSGCDWAINAMPAGIDHVDVKDIILQVIDAATGGGETIAERVYDRIALTVARGTAIPYGKGLNQDEMTHLLSQLLQLPNPNYTPDGKTIVTVLTSEQIEKLF